LRLQYQPGAIENRDFSTISADNLAENADLEGNRAGEFRKGDFGL